MEGTRVSLSRWYVWNWKIVWGVDELLTRGVTLQSCRETLAVWHIKVMCSRFELLFSSLLLVRENFVLAYILFFYVILCLRKIRQQLVRACALCKCRPHQSSCVSTNPFFWLSMRISLFYYFLLLREEHPSDIYYEKVAQYLRLVDFCNADKIPNSADPVELKLHRQLLEVKTTIKHNLATSLIANHLASLAKS